jgi:hypothetical protein
MLLGESLAGLSRHRHGPNKFPLHLLAPSPTTHARTTILPPTHHTHTQPPLKYAIPSQAAGHGQRDIYSALLIMASRLRPR